MGNYKNHLITISGNLLPETDKKHVIEIIAGILGNKILRRIKGEANDGGKWLIFEVMCTENELAAIEKKIKSDLGSKKDISLKSY